MGFIEQVKETDKMTKKETIEQFSNIKGIGKSKAELLFDNGFISLEKIKKASIEDLTKIKGINEKLAIQIKKQISNQNKTNEINKIDQEKIKDKEKIKKTDETDTEIIKKTEEKKYQVKIKPKLTKNLIKNLQIRKQIKKRTPTFFREEWFRYKRIPKNWRRPDGITSKMRINLKYRPNKVRVGYRSPKEVRGLHSSGFEEVSIYNINELKNIDNKKQAIRIGSTVGTKKRIQIEKKAEDLEIRILNIVRGKND
jgi:large subunit ribosomal protein L32e